MRGNNRKQYQIYIHMYTHTHTHTQYDIYTILSPKFPFFCPHCLVYFLGYHTKYITHKVIYVHHCFITGDNNSVPVSCNKLTFMCQLRGCSALLLFLPHGTIIQKQDPHHLPCSGN
jgi:hypothetical protein